MFNHCCMKRIHPIIPMHPTMTTTIGPLSQHLTLRWLFTNALGLSKKSLTKAHTNAHTYKVATSHNRLSSPVTSTTVTYLLLPYQQHHFLFFFNYAGKLKKFYFIKNINLPNSKTWYHSSNCASNCWFCNNELKLEMKSLEWIYFKLSLMK